MPKLTPAQRQIVEKIEARLVEMYVESCRVRDALMTEGGRFEQNGLGRGIVRCIEIVRAAKKGKL